jgi:hypothetical protein
VDRLNTLHIGLLKAAGVELVRGWGRFCGPNAVEVGNAAGEVCRLTGERILIAVGGRPHRPEIPGAELGWVKRLLASGNVSLIDVRTPVEYRAGHIVGAINIPLNDLSERSQPPRG